MNSNGATYEVIIGFIKRYHFIVRCRWCDWVFEQFKVAGLCCVLSW